MIVSLSYNDITCIKVSGGINYLQYCLNTIKCSRALLISKQVLRKDSSNSYFITT